MSDATTKADDVALELERAIVSGRIPPGTVLRQDALSEEYGVSRTPIREALRRLAALGLVSFEPNRGVRVRTLSREELREAFLVRAELESLVTEVAAGQITRSELDELEQIERRFSVLTDELRRSSEQRPASVVTDWVRTNHAFHDVIYRVAALPLRRADGEERPLLGLGRLGARRPGRARRPLRRERAAAPRAPGCARSGERVGRPGTRTRARPLLRCPARADSRPGSFGSQVTDQDPRSA